MSHWKLAARLVTLSIGLAIAPSAWAQNVADLSLAFTADPGSTTDVPVQPLEPPIAMTYGGTGDYPLSVANAGPNRATNVQITGTLPAGTSLGSATGCTLTTVTAADGTTSLDFPCVVGDMLEKTSVDVVITLALDAPAKTATACPPATVGAVSFHVASVATTGASGVPASSDPAAGNNDVNVPADTTAAQPVADLAVTLDGPAFSSVDGLVTFSGTLTNNGLCPAPKPRVLWASPGNVELQVGQGTGATGCDPTWGDPNGGTSTNRCTFPALAAGGSVSFSRVFKILKPPSGTTSTASPVELTTSSGTVTLTSKVPLPPVPPGTPATFTGFTARTGAFVASSDLKSSNNVADFQTVTPVNDGNGCSSTGGAMGLVTVLGLLGAAVLRRRRA